MLCHSFPPTSQCQVETINLLLQEGFSPFLALPDLEHLCSCLRPTLVTLANQGFFTPVQKLIGGLPIIDKLLTELVTLCNQQTFGVDHLGFVFHTVCGLGNIGLVRLMLENASDVSSTEKLDSQKRSPLFHAALFWWPPGNYSFPD